MEKPNLILLGKVIALSQVQEIPSKEAGKPAMKKRELYMDCTRYDYLTGERIGFENKPLLEFGGEKVLDKLAALNLQKDDIVAVRFDIQGNPYKDEKTGKTRVFTAVRCYDIEVVRKAGQPVQQPAPQPQPQQQAEQTQGNRGYDPAAMPPTQSPQTQQSDGNHEEPLPF